MPSRYENRHAVARTLCVAAAFLLGAGPAAGETTLRGSGVVVTGHGGVGRHALRRVVNRAEADLALVARFLDASGRADPIRITVYESIEAKGMATGYTLPVHSYVARRDIHYAAEPGFDGDLAMEVARIVLRDRLGKPRMEVLETGLAAGLIADWRGRGALHWAGTLGAQGDLADVGRLADNRDFARRSELVTTPVAAALAAFLVERWGREEFLSRYAAWDGAGADSLSVPFGRFLHRLRARGTREDLAAVELPPFQRGFCHAHEGYQIHNGYGSAASDAALAKLAAMGANAVSITPFTYMPGPRRPAEFPFSNGAGSENDECVIHAIRAAHAAGMAVMLKPHVWMRGSWPGEIEMTTDADWEEFFGHYARWIRHYALMAEMYRVELLCIGVEMSRTTMAQPGRWRELIGQLRTIYSGRMTYAANWGPEFESIDLWGDLDYVAVNCYYPLSDSAAPTDADLLAGADAVLDRVGAVGERWKRPVLVTEVGFSSAPAPWLEPHRRRHGEGVDVTAQARCYDAFFRALAGRDDFAGIYWWKWPSVLGLGGPAHSGFTPNNKPAEDIVRRWYGAKSSD